MSSEIGEICKDLLLVGLTLLAGVEEALEPLDGALGEGVDPVL